jgi:hypothetical protein
MIAWLALLQIEQEKKTPYTHATKHGNARLPELVVGPRGGGGGRQKLALPALHLQHVQLSQVQARAQLEVDEPNCPNVRLLAVVHAAATWP